MSTEWFKESFIRHQFIKKEIVTVFPLDRIQGVIVKVDTAGCQVIWFLKNMKLISSFQVSDPYCPMFLLLWAKWNQLKIDQEKF